MRESYEKHYDMWDWLYSHPTKTKEDYLDLCNDDEWPKHECFLCEEYESCAPHCPLFKAQGAMCAYHGSYFWMWATALLNGDPKTARKWAGKIRDVVK